MPCVFPIILVTQTPVPARSRAFSPLTQVPFLSDTQPFLGPSVAASRSLPQFRGSHLVREYMTSPGCKRWALPSCSTKRPFPQDGLMVTCRPGSRHLKIRVSLVSFREPLEEVLHHNGHFKSSHGACDTVPKDCAAGARKGPLSPCCAGGLQPTLGCSQLTCPCSAYSFPAHAGCRSSCSPAVRPFLHVVQIHGSAGHLPHSGVVSTVLAVTPPFPVTLGDLSHPELCVHCLVTSGGDFSLSPQLILCFRNQILIVAQFHKF